MSFSLLSVALLASSALAAPQPKVEVVEVRQALPTDLEDLASLLPSDLGDLSSLLPTDLGDLSTLLPSDLGDLASLTSLLPDPSSLPSLDFSSLLGGLETLIPSACLPPSDFIPPTPAPELASAILTWTDYCETPSFTGVAGQQYSSYESAISSWAEENGPRFSSWSEAYLTACPLVSEYASLIPTGSADISSLLASYSAYTCGGSSAPKPTGNGTVTTGSATAEPTGAQETGDNSSEFPGAAPQQTAFAAAAGLVAGIAGVIAVL